MKVNELRIGNLLYNSRLGEVITFDLSDFGMIYSKSEGIGIDNYKPVSLTEEWLLKFGFKNIDETDYIKRFVIMDQTGFIKFMFVFNKEKGLIERKEYGLPENIGSVEYGNSIYFTDFAMINNVHQLQNLYFALTGEELKKNL